MRTLIRISLVLLAIAWLGLVASGAAADDGKSIYLESKCNECHALAAEGIEVVEPEEAEEEDPFGFGDDEEEEEEEAGDLSNVGSEHDADWLVKYLKKTVANEDGKKHRKRFKGSDEALRDLSAWLATMKTPVAEN